MTFFPTLTPAYASVGQGQQDMVIEYPCDLRDHMFIKIFKPNIADNSSIRVPVNPLGSKAVKAKLPSFDVYGIYTAVPVFPVDTDAKFPPFELRVLSPVETLINVLAPDEDPYHITASQTTNAVVAALFAYLIQTEEQGTQSIEMIDTVLSQILPNMDRPITSIAQFLSGKYMHTEETLLHFCIRRKYLNTCEYISQNLYNGFGQSLSLEGIDGKTSLELAEMSQMQPLSTVLKTYIETANQGTVENAESEPHPGLRSRFHKIKTAIKRRTVKAKSEDDSSNAGQQSLTSDMVRNLKITALYSAEVIEPYSAEDKDFGTVSIQLGNIAFVTREEDKYWCTGIVNEKYCRFPVNILQGTSYKKYISDRIPQPKDLINSCEIRDAEELETFVAQHKKYVEYMNEKENSRVTRRLAYISPVTRSSSMDTGLNELSNCSPILKKRKPLPPAPIPASPMQQQQDSERKQNRPLPKPPVDDDSSSDDYETPDIHNIISPKLKQSPLTRRRTDNNFKDTEQPAARSSLHDDFKNRSSLISNQSSMSSCYAERPTSDSDSGIYVNASNPPSNRFRLPSIASQSNEAGVINSPQSSLRKIEPSVSQVSIESDDGEYVDVATAIQPLRQYKQTKNVVKPQPPPINLKPVLNTNEASEPVKSPRPPPTSMKPSRNPSQEIDGTQSERMKPQPPPTSMKPSRNPSQEIDGIQSERMKPQPPPTSMKPPLRNQNHGITSETQSDCMKPQPPPISSKPRHNKNWEPATCEWEPQQKNPGSPHSSNRSLQTKELVMLKEKARPLPLKNSQKSSPQPPPRQFITTPQSPKIGQKVLVLLKNSPIELDSNDTSAQVSSTGSPQTGRPTTVREYSLMFSSNSH